MPSHQDAEVPTHQNPKEHDAQDEVGFDPKADVEVPSHQDAEVPTQLEEGFDARAEEEANADVEVPSHQDAEVPTHQNAQDVNVKEQDAVVPYSSDVEPLPCKNEVMKFTFNFNIGMLHFRNLSCQLIQ